MTAPNLPTEHEENNFFDAIERELVALTTAKLEEKPVSRAPMALPPPFSPKTVKPALAGIQTECDVPADKEGGATQPGDGSRRAPGRRSTGQRP